MTELLRRKPFLWDNSLANDGAESSNRLHLAAYGTDFSELGGLLSGHAVNPMNQAWLSRIPLRILSDSYDTAKPHDPNQSFAAVCQSLCGAALGAEIVCDLDLFRKHGLRAIPAADRHDLVNKYSQFDGDPYAQEIPGWLRNEYEFDPACLTD